MVTEVLPTALFSLDLFIFVAFLATTLAVGLSTKRHITTMQEYALGGKNFSTFTLTATIVATFFGAGSVAFYPAYFAEKGLLLIIPDSLGAFLGILFAGQVLALRMGKFADNVSTAEAMGSMYGTTVQIISAISGSIFQIGLTAAQFQVMAKVLSLIWGYEDRSLLIIALITVLLYSVWGGIRAVTFTDVVQFLTFGAFIPILALVMWNNLEDPQQISLALGQNNKFHWREIITWNAEFINALALMLYFTTIGINPYLFQRLPMARNMQQAKTAFTYAAFIILFILLLLVWVAILLLANKVSLAPGGVLNYFVAQSSFMGFRGLLASGIMALALSTADSSINTCAVLLTNDVAFPLGLSRNKVVTIARLATVLVGTLGLVLALYGNDVLSLLFLSSGFYLPIAGTPLLLAILGFRSNKRSVLISMVAGLATVLLWRTFLAHTGIDALMPATLANAFVLLGRYYLLGDGEGWQKVDPDSPLGRERTVRRENWEARKEAIKNFRPHPYLQQNLPQQESLYILLGFYAIATTYIGFYTIEQADIKTYERIYTGIYQTLLLLTTVLITYPVWPSWMKSQRWMIFFWPLAVGGILFFAGSLLVLIRHFHPLQVMVLMANFLVAALLLQASLVLVLVLGGVGAGLLLFHYCTGEALLQSSTAAWPLNMLQSSLLLVSLLIILFMGKEFYQQLGKRNLALQSRSDDHQLTVLRLAAEKIATLRGLAHTEVKDLLALSSALQKLPLEGAVADQMEIIQKRLTPLAFQLQDLDTRGQDYLRLFPGKLSIAQCWKDVKAAVQKKGVSSALYLKHATRYQQITCDPGRVTELLTKAILLVDASSQDEDRTLTVAVDDTQLSYPMFNILGGYKELPAVRMVVTTLETLPELASRYTYFPSDSALITPTTVGELEAFTNTRTVRAHYGYIEEHSHTLLYVLPVDLTEVRPRDLDKDYLAIGAAPKRSDDQYKNAERGIDAQAQEQAFLIDVAKRSKADLKLVKMALELIKWYHGPQERHSGEPFYLHPLTVAHIVLDYNQDEATIIGALLHDTVEDTPLLLKHIESLFGKETAEVVDLVTHLQNPAGGIHKVQLSAEEHLKRLERASNKRGLYVKIADRLHNMRTINGHNNAAKRKLIVEETMDFFVPLAKEVGLTEVAQELEKGCLEVLAAQE